METQIKVNDTRMHKVTIQKGMGYSQERVGDVLSIPVVEAKLVLVEDNKGGSTLLFNDKTMKPILISETEKIEEGKVWDGYEGKIVWAHKEHLENVGYMRLRKILALPEHFSPKHLQAIADGKMKDGDKVLVECKFSIETLKGREYEVKLNSLNHITLHKVEEKMGIPLSILEDMEFEFHKEEDRHDRINVAYHEGVRAFMRTIDQWFEQNVK